VANATAGVGDLRAVVPLVLFVLGLRGLMVEERMVFPSWYDYFWFAFGSFFMLNRDTQTKV
jgi:hypothetical protein